MTLKRLFHSAVKRSFKKEGPSENGLAARLLPDTLAVVAALTRFGSELQFVPWKTPEDDSDTDVVTAE